MTDLTIRRVSGAGGAVLDYACCVRTNHAGGNNLQPIRTLYIDDICVDESARGTHVGSELHHHVLDHAHNDGCHNVTLNAWAANPGAVKFYERLGMSVYKYGMEQILQSHCLHPYAAPSGPAACDPTTFGGFGDRRRFVGIRASLDYSP